MCTFKNNRKNMKKIMLIGLLLTTNYAYTAAAKVLFVKNKVTASHNGAQRTLSRGSSVDAGDLIVTAAEAAVHIQYGNGTLVNIGSDSKYKILSYSPQKKDNEINAELSKGKLETSNKGKIKETLKTPIVSLAILGTHVRVYASISDKVLGNRNKRECAGLRGSEQTNVEVIEGRVSTRGQVLKAGQSVRISCDNIEQAAFPAQGVVNSPLNAPGKIEDVSGGAAGSSGGGGTESSNEQIGAEIGADATTFIASYQDVGSTTVSGTEAIIAVTELATISIVCSL
jgi:hypothetical protein